MAVLSRTVRSKSSRMSKKQGKTTASAGRASRRLIRAKMKQMKATRREFSTNGAVRKDGATKQSATAPLFKHPHPKTELEAASQRYLDSEERYRTLFNLVPMAVYSVDASGVIQRIQPPCRRTVGPRASIGGNRRAVLRLVQNVPTGRQFYAPRAVSHGRGGLGQKIRGA